LRENWPRAYIELIGYPHIANLALAGGLVDHVDSLDRAEMARFFAKRPAFSPDQAAWIESFHFILSYLHDPDGVVQNNLLAAGARQLLYGSPIVAAGHAVDHLIKPLESFAIYESGAAPRLELPTELRQQGNERRARMGLTGRAVALHPGSGSPKKNCPAERFLKLAQGLAAAEWWPFFILGEADDGARRALAAARAEFPVLTDCTLVELAAGLAGCAGYVGNDSGITHLAAALGLPVVALFGPSNPENWGPRGTRVTILRAPQGDLAALTVETVLAAALGKLPA